MSTAPAVKLPNMPAPCEDCPFKKDTLRGWLGRERMTEILAAASFTCHKDNSKQCAGHMLIKGTDNSFVRLAAGFGMALKLKGGEAVFPSEQECIDHHSLP
jgi:hypothetical protein